MTALRIRRPAFARVGFLVVLLAVTALLLPGRALAHPLGNFSINRYARIEVYRDTLRLHYVLDYAEIPAYQLQDQVDANRDGEMSQGELDAYALRSRTEFPKNFDLSVDGKKLAVTPVGQSIQSLPGQGGIPIVRVVYIYDAPVPATDATVTITFSDRNFSAKGGWKEIVVRPSEGAEVTVDPAFLVERSDALRSYPAEALTSAPNDREVAFGWRAGTGAAAPAVAIDAAAKGRSSSGLAALLDEDGSIPIIVLSLFVAFVLGAQHAIGPGHGKAMVAAYLVGSKGKPRHAVALGVTVTATHTSTVWLLTLVTLVAAEFITPDTLFFYLGLCSGAMVVIVGAALFVTRLRGVYRRGHPGEATHRHGWFGKAHTHALAEPGAGQVDDPTRQELPAGDITWRSLLALGISGGLLPCPSAIIVMLAAISFGKILFGMALVVTFSLGLAFVLSAIGIALVLGRTASERSGASSLLGRPVVARIITLMPILSAFGVVLAGLYITYEAWSTPL